MKERVFYVINLDKQRIGVLSLFLFALFFSIFFLGVSVGRGKQEEAQSLQKKSEETQGKSEVTDTTIPSPTQTSGADLTAGTNVASSLVQGTKTKEQTFASQEIPMADVGNHPYFVETSTAKDEEEEKKQQIVDLTKRREKQVVSTKQEERFKNLAPTSKASKSQKLPSQVISANKTEGKQFTIQLAAFTSRQSAETFLSQLKTDNNGKLPAKSFIVVKNGYFVVQMGKSKDKGSLSKIISKTSMPKEIKSKAMVVSYQPLS
ncbi:SPOR domain-containing protein [Leptospira sp. 2 VSF19]|uniref:SPOR domain-containing protein n=1 Tax=Leptospira soteropolitanensis TaxID=2950025 RepID=A0AAW5VF67_9LEPT|nr:SPOR domain-containing protein [Leptospira soteropolitanensis]MCW7492807.1 SPOR domain-containing protein [Leptospira soteropolitanensis]MCW7500042.1 SPOR domain-containing protein [Leptospira soteropolitanensis]MCW7522293.1 SPOR domain-containing protein [Leptospira soteropolitanensis]MCW7526149.1 SPOR domain-containing protein [Leptospira soteropolitanensis]MCW7529739.1 SPOR domain-containing protein [Leptospira soteropolitanensis]